MICYIYKAGKQPDTYLYLQQVDEFAPVPESLIKALGELSLVMELEINRDTRLARANPEAVLRQIDQDGYYLQMPPRLQGQD